MKNFQCLDVAVGPALVVKRTSVLNFPRVSLMRIFLDPDQNLAVAYAFCLLFMKIRCSN